MRIAVLMTCFNRREQTLRAIEAAKTACPANVELLFYVTDDASSDGTAAAISTHYPDVTVINGPGDLYWNGGMRNAWQSALSSTPDFYLWLNDDLEVCPAAFASILEDWRTHTRETTDVVLVGRTVSAITGTPTYGGLRRASGVSRLRFRQMSETEVCCDTMNGNFVLIPAHAVNRIGLNSNRYTHAFGDIDYGLRARKAKFALIQSTRPVGLQERNGVEYTTPKSLRPRDLIAFATHPKGMPIPEWLYFCRQHGGWQWPLNFISMYAKPILKAFRARQPDHHHAH